MGNTDEIEIFEKNMKLAYMVAHRYKNYPKEKEDITQIALEGLWLAIKNYDEKKSKFATFAVRIMTNNINYYLRSVKKESNIISLYDSIPGNTENIEYIDVISDNSFGIEDLETKIFIKDTLENLNANLEEKERIIFKYWLEGKKQIDIADLLGVSQPSISRSITEIRRKLKR